MSLLESLSPKKGSTYKSKRIGRGNGSGKGGTAGKGHKGQKARAGGSIIRGFEGGQTPLARRLPKFGFSNVKFTTRYEIVNLTELNKFSGDVTIDVLKESGLVKKGPVKILGEGELTATINISANKFSKSAQKAIEDKGGKVEVVK
ncbi:MAG: 50S ribosomal protein L15 [Bdellovibrionaceae bacterium]|jgi:large subunit ribosomal protein L15|nr:50S ribosomal protein L15 [Pseudobdellovibrionaceae bacterium]